MKNKWHKKPDDADKLELVRQKYKYKCKHCGWFNIIYPFEKRVKKVCKNCGHYVYISSRAEFEDKLKEVMK